MAYLDQSLLGKVARLTGKTPKYIREKASRRASREGVETPVVLIMWARELGIGVASVVKKLDPRLQQQLSVSRVVVSPGPAPKRPASRRRKSGTRSPSSRGSDVLVFVSHSSKDEKLVEKLVDLLRAAFNLPSKAILATSVDGHKLKSGVVTDEALRRDVLECKVLIGVISPASQKSTYVLFELGARWGTGKPFHALRACGLRAKDLRGPLAGMQVLDCSDEGDLHSFLGDVGTDLEQDRDEVMAFQKRLETLARLSRANAKKAK